LFSGFYRSQSADLRDFITPSNIETVGGSIFSSTSEDERFQKPFIAVLLQDVAAAKDGLQLIGTLGREAHRNIPHPAFGILPSPAQLRSAKSHSAVTRHRPLQSWLKMVLACFSPYQSTRLSRYDAVFRV
jgi:hypothetical protein